MNLYTKYIAIYVVFSFSLGNCLHTIVHPQVLDDQVRYVASTQYIYSVENYHNNFSVDKHDKYFNCQEQECYAALKNLEWIQSNKIFDLILNFRNKNNPDARHILLEIINEFNNIIQRIKKHVDFQKFSLEQILSSFSIVCVEISELMFLSILKQKTRINHVAFTDRLSDKQYSDFCNELIQSKDNKFSILKMIFSKFLIYDKKHANTYLPINLETKNEFEFIHDLKKYISDPIYRNFYIKYKSDLVSSKFVKEFIELVLNYRINHIKNPSDLLENILFIDGTSDAVQFISNKLLEENIIITNIIDIIGILITLCIEFSDIKYISLLKQHHNQNDYDSIEYIPWTNLISLSQIKNAYLELLYRNKNFSGHHNGDLLAKSTLTERATFILNKFFIYDGIHDTEKNQYPDLMLYNITAYMKKIGNLFLHPQIQYHFSFINVKNLLRNNFMQSLNNLSNREKYKIIMPLEIQVNDVETISIFNNFYNVDLNIEEYHRYVRKRKTGEITVLRIVPQEAIDDKRNNLINEEDIYNFIISNNDNSGYTLGIIFFLFTCLTDIKNINILDICYKVKTNIGNTLDLFAYRFNSDIKYPILSNIIDMQKNKNKSLDISMFKQKIDYLINMFQLNISHDIYNQILIAFIKAFMNNLGMILDRSAKKLNSTAKKSWLYTTLHTEYTHHNVGLNIKSEIFEIQQAMHRTIKLKNFYQNKPNVIIDEVKHLGLFIFDQGCDMYQRQYWENIVNMYNSQNSDIFESYASTRETENMDRYHHIRQLRLWNDRDNDSNYQRFYYHYTVKDGYGLIKDFGYESVNNVLRYGIPQKPWVTALKRINEYIIMADVLLETSFNSYLYTTPENILEPGLSFRAVRSLSSINEVLLNNVGGTYNAEGYFSTSLKDSHIQHFIRKSIMQYGQQPLYLFVLGYNGKDIEKKGKEYITSEAEILYHHDTKFKIQGVAQSNGYCSIFLKEIIDDNGLTLEQSAKNIETKLKENFLDNIPSKDKIEIDESTYINKQSNVLYHVLYLQYSNNMDAFSNGLFFGLITFNINQIESFTLEMYSETGRFEINNRMLIPFPDTSSVKTLKIEDYIVIIQKEIRDTLDHYFARKSQYPNYKMIYSTYPQYIFYANKSQEVLAYITDPSVKQLTQSKRKFEKINDYNNPNDIDDDMIFLSKHRLHHIRYFMFQGKNNSDFARGIYYGEIKKEDGKFLFWFGNENGRIQHHEWFLYPTDPLTFAGDIEESFIKVLHKIREALFCNSDFMRWNYIDLLYYNKNKIIDFSQYNPKWVMEEMRYNVTQHNYSNVQQ